MRPVDPEKMRRMEAVCREIGHQIGHVIEAAGGEKQGFALFVFSFEGPEFTYISNSRREDMIKVCEDFIRTMRDGASTTSEQRN